MRDPVLGALHKAKRNKYFYGSAARRLKKMRKLAAGSGESTDVDKLIADLRGRHRRRPRLQQEFDRVGLP